MQTSIEYITPELAQAMLRKNSSNRTIRSTVVNKYARDMRMGAWKTSHQGIAFYKSGVLADGQHRLAAIVKAGVPIEMMVVRGLSEDDSYGIDQHAQRNAADTLKIAGNEWINRKVISVVRFMAIEMQNQYARSISTTEIERYAEENKDGILFATQYMKKSRGIGSSGFSACIACAWINGEMPSDLENFLAVMHTGLATQDYEISAIKLRELLLTDKTCWHSGRNRRSTARKVQRVIKAFCSQEKITRLVEPSRFIYPAPKPLLESQDQYENARKTTADSI